MGLLQLLKNIRTLRKISLKDMGFELSTDVLNRMDDYYRYEIINSGDYFESMPYLKVLDSKKNDKFIIRKSKELLQIWRWRA